jgi:hypothetical protein
MGWLGLSFHFSAGVGLSGPILSGILNSREQGIQNFERYKVLVDSWQLYDNSDTPPALLDEI